MYQKMYITLFNAITKALEDIDKQDIPTAVNRLLDAQRHTEIIYLNWKTKRIRAQKNGKT